MPLLFWVMDNCTNVQSKTENKTYWFMENSIMEQPLFCYWWRLDILPDTLLQVHTSVMNGASNLASFKD